MFFYFYFVDRVSEALQGNFERAASLHLQHGGSMGDGGKLAACKHMCESAGGIPWQQTWKDSGPLLPLKGNSEKKKKKKKRVIK